MSIFTYLAVDAEGRRLRGRAEAMSVEELTRILGGQGLIVVEASPVEGGRDGSLVFRSARRRAVADVTRALAALLPAGLPLARALSVSANIAGAEVSSALHSIRRRVERGDDLAGALGEHPHLFPAHYVGMVRAGERSGELAGAFRRLAEQLDREAALRDKLLSASIYPMLLAGVGGLAVIVLLLFVLPRFVELLEGAGATLPRSTALLLAVSTTAQRFWPIAILGGGGLLVLSGAYLRTEAGQRAGALAFLAVPIVSGLRRDALAGRFARLTAVLLGGGAPLLAALDDAAASMGDPLARGEAARIRTRVREGASFAQAVVESTLFPPVLGQLVAVGEEAGRVEEFLGRAADLFEDRTERMLQRLVTLLEPVMIIGFGVVVAVVAVSLLQAIYGVNAGAFR